MPTILDKFMYAPSERPDQSFAAALPDVDVETLIVSDVHLGIKSSRPQPLLQILQNCRYQRLILLGDILHDHNIWRFCSKSWEF